MDYTVHGILQARILERRVAFPFSGDLPTLQVASLLADPLKYHRKDTYCPGDTRVLKGKEAEWPRWGINC